MFWGISKTLINCLFETTINNDTCCFLFSDRFKRSNNCGTYGKPAGKCIFIKNCTPMTNFLRKINKPYPQYIVKELNSYSCDYRDNKLYICCPSTPINIVDPTKITTSSAKFDPPDISNHKNLKLLPKDCGYLEIGDKIRKGINATLNEFPWMALLSYETGKYFSILLIVQ